MPCKRKSSYGNGRCRLHGELSTGPRTEEDKQPSAFGNLTS
ncbi:HGGxSTG domain-containing protein [Desulfovibrio sp.]